MLFKSEISFLERPGSEDELLIADLMRKYFRALKEHNLELLLSLFREDARINSRVTGGIISLKQYGDAMRNALPFIDRIYLRDLIIRINGNETAIVYGSSCYDSSHYDASGMAGRWWRRMWGLNKTGTRWAVTELNYYDS